MVASRSFIAIPPGMTIKEQLNDRGMTQKEFSARMDMTEKHISKLINGEVQLTADMAVRLEMVLGVPARYWSNLEAIYREKLIKAEAENSLDSDADLARQMPYSEMAKNGWVPETRVIGEKVNHLRRYFEVVNLALLGKSQITHIACRRLSVTDKGDLALMAWAQEAKREARHLSTMPIDIKRILHEIPRYRKLTKRDPEEFVPQLRDSLASCGIALVILPHLKGSYLQGATFLDGNKIVMGLTDRGKDADRFWFSFFHELAHIILGHINNKDGTNEQEEDDADTWAGNQLISPGMYLTFKESGNYSENSIIQFANEIGIAPGIVVGRLQNDKLIRPNQLNHLKNKYELAGIY